MPNHRLLTLVTMAGLLLLAGTATAAELDWKKVVGVQPNKLSAKQKSRAVKLLGQLNNTRGCQGTLAQCVAKNDMTARRHAGFVARMVRKNKTDDEIKQGIAQRHESAFPEEILPIDVSDHPYKGNPKAKVVIVEFACFQCPFCAHLAPQLKQFHKRFGDKIVHYFKFFPVRSHKRGVASSLAGVSAYRQGKFWPLHDLMFANRADLDDDDLLAYAKKVGLDVAKFQSKLKDSTTMRYIEKDKLEGMRVGVEGTPSFFINGKLYTGANDLQEIADRIAEEIDIVEGRIK